MMDRTELLRALVEYRLPVAHLVADLATYGWDSDRELVTLERRHIRAVLDRYRRGDLSATDIEEWANALEGREDIGYESGVEDRLRDAIHELANPLLTRPLSPASTRELMTAL